MQRKTDLATGKPIDLGKPEEKVRQEYEQILLESYKYPKGNIDIEVPIPRGSRYFDDKADIVVYDGLSRDPAQDIIGIIETKRRGRKDGTQQLKSYMTATSALWGVWTNGDSISYLYREGTKIRDNLNNIPVYGQSIKDIGRLKKSDLKPFKRGELRVIFRRILRTLYSNTEISRKEKLGSEMIKLIFAKLEDESKYPQNPPDFRAEFREDPKTIAARIKKLFKRVREELKHDGIFKAHDDIELDNRSIAWVVGQLERGSLLATDSDIVGDAFEVFSESNFVGEKGEFFTPRGVVQLAVRLANPQPEESICDPACGSAGFLIYAMKHVWKLMNKHPKWCGGRNIKDHQRTIAARYFFGIDKETDLVKIAKAHMAIAGDGRSNIVHANSLHKPDEFERDAKKFFVQADKFKKFDYVLTNPPYGAKVKVLPTDAKNFDLGHKWKKLQDGTWEKTNSVVARDPYVLFIELCLSMLKNNGTLAIVLPETLFHAPKLGYARQYLLSENNLIAIIDLPHNTFRPYCNAKTCLLVLRKRQKQSKSIIMGTPQEMGHDHQGRDLINPQTRKIWDDLSESLEELKSPKKRSNKHIFSIDRSKLQPNILIPKFYRQLDFPVKIPKKRCGISLETLVKEGIVDVWDGHGSPPSQDKGKGNIPYIRVADIVNWELYRNPVSGIPEETYLSILGRKKPPQEEDVIFVKRGSYRIGTVAMASPRDNCVLLTRELLTFRIKNKKNMYGVTSFYLLAMLSSKEVQEQIPYFVYVDTTLPNIGDRWKYLLLPFHKTEKEIKSVGVKVEDILRKKWDAQNKVDELRDTCGDMVT